MGWALGGLGVFILLVLVAGVTVVIYKRYSTTWQCGPRDVWIICDEWRRKLAWLWAPREEKVGLVKAQHPTAHAVPGLYRQTSNTSSSQYIMHSDSDLRLDAQGAFTRFEAVDRNLEIPESQRSPPSTTVVSVTSSPPNLNVSPTSIQPSVPNQPGSASNGDLNTEIPPQPLRPAPQPRSTPRPRPSPLRADYLRLMRECEPSPLTPPPGLISHSKFNGHRQERGVFLFHQPDAIDSRPDVELPPTPPPLPPPPQMSQPARQRLEELTLRANAVQQQIDGQLSKMSCQEALSEGKIRYKMPNAIVSNDIFAEKSLEFTNGTDSSYGTYDIVHGSISDFSSIYAPQSLIRRVPSTRNLCDLESLGRFSGFFEDDEDEDEEKDDDEEEEDEENEQEDEDEATMSPAAPPPPAPPDPPTNDHLHQQQQQQQRNGSPEPATTGERIFKALRAVTSQSYIDASDFYNSIWSSTQHAQTFSFANAANQLVSDGLNNSLEDNRPFSPFERSDQPPLMRTDLFNPELNQEAHRTAQEVYHSLHDAEVVHPLLLKDVDQQTYSSYMSSDPSFTRTSEEIFNSLEQCRRASQERLNEYQEMQEMLELQEAANESVAISRRNSQELLSALEETQLRYRLAQLFEDCRNEFLHEQQQQQQQQNGSASSSRRASLGNGSGSNEPAHQPIIDFANLRRAISIENVESDRLLDDLEEEPQNKLMGMICVTIECDRFFAGWPSSITETDLSISVVEARNLVTIDGRPAQHTYARLYVLPDMKPVGATRPCKDTNSPSIHETFYYPLIDGPSGRSLLIEVYWFELANREEQLLGVATLDLSTIGRPSSTSWLMLLKPEPQLGELMFSLSYLPTAERLTLVVVKARNLKSTHETSGFFVKVYLMQQGMKLHKKRTSIKRGEKSPIFNEAFNFSLPHQSLQNIQLKLTVAEVSGDPSSSTKPISVGRLTLGASSTGRELTHWRKMLAELRRPVAMWHPLTK